MPERRQRRIAEHVGDPAPPIDRAPLSAAGLPALIGNRAFTRAVASGALAGAGGRRIQRWEQHTEQMPRCGDWNYAWGEHNAVEVTAGGMRFVILRVRPAPELNRAIDYLRHRTHDVMTDETDHRQYTSHIVRGISDLFGGAEEPPLLRWDAVLREAEAARNAAAACDLAAAIAALERGWQAFTRYKRDWTRYMDATAEGGATTAEGLGWVSAIAITVAATGLTGGTAAAFGITSLAGQAAVGAGISGGLALGVEAGREVGEELADIEPGIDWQGALARVGISTATGFVSGLAGGPARDFFAKRLGYTVRPALQPGARPQSLQPFLIEFAKVLAGRGPSVPVTPAVVEQVAPRLLGGTAQSLLAEAARTVFQTVPAGTSVEEFFDRYVENLLSRGLGRVLGQILVGGAAATP